MIHFVEGRDEWFILSWRTVSGAPRWYTGHTREDIAELVRQLKEVNRQCIAVYHVRPKPRYVVTPYEEGWVIRDNLKGTITTIGGMRKEALESIADYLSKEHVKFSRPPETIRHVSRQEHRMGRATRDVKGKPPVVVQDFAALQEKPKRTRKKKEEYVNPLGFPDVKISPY
ncbi:hypothetical protein CC53_gp101 [Rhizobium phage vB_RleS_L338C]|uniref:hypothetical protein n=1 Tax=Rhizobium phage vB_RleS_L338C TaxID=1414737 RepID=UPI0003D947C3|nr:hypothetical protein CC53_gp101 [Rhizobium phage vB_RleS_L338C]AHC30518.1 hypothetical protein L338C_101 [Rhizobium phage vB_RleS_L338C]QNH72094.1 hypothetical protein P11VFA_049 [Rhizobium phage P11VFA]